MKNPMTSEGPPATEIRLLSARLRGISYLLENFHDDVGEPLDIEDIHWGIGMILTKMSQELKYLSILLERSEIKPSKRKRY